MKTLLLVLFSALAAHSQIPYSSEKKEEQRANKADFDRKFMVPKGPYRKFSEPTQQPQPSAENQLRRFQMPVKQVVITQHNTPVLRVWSFDEMNADFYFKQKRLTLSDPQR